MCFKNIKTIGVHFTLPDNFCAGYFESKIESPYSSEKTCNFDGLILQQAFPFESSPSSR